MLGGEADVVLSDLAANATGHARTDHLKIMALVEAAADFAREVLAPGGTFLAKVLQGGTESALLAGLKRNFVSVRHEAAGEPRELGRALSARDRIPRQPRLAPDLVEGGGARGRGPRCGCRFRAAAA